VCEGDNRLDDDWGFASHLQIVRPKAVQADSVSGNRANSVRKPNQQLWFTAMGATFKMDIAESPLLVGAELSGKSVGRPIIGRNLRVTQDDGSEDFVEAPFARFMMEEL
jgi:hypothetical protein